MTKTMLTFAKIRPYIGRITLCAALFVAISIPAIATPQDLAWTDRSDVLPFRDGRTITHVSTRGSSALVSDGEHLYRFDGVIMTDITADARAHGLTSIGGIFTDGRDWLVYTQPQNNTQAVIWLTDGVIWRDASQTFGTVTNGLDAVGHDGAWYVRAYQRGEAGHPTSYTFYRWNGFAKQAELLTLPNEVATFTSDCFAYANGSTLCTGFNKPIYLNHEWYFVGGTSQALGPTAAVTQQPTSGIWKINGSSFQKLKDLPNVSFVSGAWSNDQIALIATNEGVTRSFSPTQWWVFDGASMREITDQALTAGLIIPDARKLLVAWNGRSWIIMHGKRYYRFDGWRFVDRGLTRDVFEAIGGNLQGSFMLGGAASTINTPNATEPRSAKFVMIQEDIQEPRSTGILPAVISKIYGPTIHVTMNPKDAHIGSGKLFRYVVEAKDDTGLESIEIFVHGTRVKTCAASFCEYTQTYWTNGDTARTVNIYARATDKEGFATDTPITKLWVDESSNATAPTSETIEGQPTLVPNTATWYQDIPSNVSWTTWLARPTLTLRADEDNTYSVAAHSVTGLRSMSIIVNGAVKRTCVLDGSKATNLCSIRIIGAEYPSNVEVFVNASITNERGDVAWTTPTRFQRDTSTVTTVNAEAQPVKPNATRIQIVSSIVPTDTRIARGTRVNFTATAINNIEGLNRIEIFLNGNIRRNCDYSNTVMSEVRCPLDLDTTEFPVGTTLTVMSRMIDRQGSETWSGNKTFTIVPESVNTNAKNDPHVFSVWSYIGPYTTELNVDETTVYTVGAWSKNGIKKMDIIVDGVTRQTCAFPDRSGTKECSFALRAEDFSHGHTATVNARVVDGSDAMLWSEASSILVKRSWEGVPSTNPYVTITSQQQQGYKDGERISLKAKGWSPKGALTIEILVNGNVVATCPTDTCTWQSGGYGYPSMEYQARLTDSLHQITWTGLYGIIKQ